MLPFRRYESACSRCAASDCPREQILWYDTCMSALDTCKDARYHVCLASGAESPLETEIPCRKNGICAPLYQTGLSTWTICIMSAQILGANIILTYDGELKFNKTRGSMNWSPVTTYCSTWATETSRCLAWLGADPVGISLHSKGSMFSSTLLSSGPLGVADCPLAEQYAPVARRYNDGGKCAWSCEALLQWSVKI